MTLWFYAELNDYLPGHQRHGSFDCGVGPSSTEGEGFVWTIHVLLFLWQSALAGNALREFTCIQAADLS